MQFLCPFIAMIAAWIVGRFILTFVKLGVRSESLAIVTGISLLIIIAGHVSFFNFPLDQMVVSCVALLLLIFFIVRKKALFQDIDLLEIFIVAILCIESNFYFLLPSFFHHANLVLLEAGDFSSYASMGSWLQERSIRVPADLGNGYNPIQFKLADHQFHHLRLGALFLYAFYASLFGIRSIVLYTSFASWLISFQVVAFYTLVRVAIPRSRAWPCMIAALAFAVNPLLTWTGYASFVPQILGIGLMMSVLAVVIRLTDSVLDAASAPESLSLAMILGILLCANWSAYPEIMPIAWFIAGCYVLVVSVRRRATPRRIFVLCGWAFASFSLAILLSPMTTYWGLKGLLDQIHMNPHGGEQVINIWTVLKTMTGASLEPLIPAALDRTTSIEALCTILIFAFVLLGFSYLAWSGQVSLILAVVITGALLFWYVGRRYGYDPEHMEADSKALLTWNYFKATQYIAPLTFLLGWGAAAHFLTGRPKDPRFLRALRSSFLTLPVLAMAILAWGQWQRIDGSASYLNITSDGARALAAIPPGRVLVSSGGDTNLDIYGRWATYALMPDRAIVAVDDAPGFNDEVDRAAEENHSEILKAPIFTVVARAPFIQGKPATSAALRFDVTDTSREIRPFTVYADGSTSSFVSIPQSPVGHVAISNVAAPQIAMLASAGLKSLPVGRLSTITTDVASLGISGLVRISGVPPTTGFLVEAGSGSGADIAPPVLRDVADLTSTINQKMIADGGGGPMLWQSHDPGFDLAMSDFGFSRLMLRLHLKPGTYFFKIEFGDLRSEVRPGTSGLGAYIGFDGHHETAVDLSHAGNSTFYYRFAVPQEGDIACGLGFGAWGAAHGRMHIRSIRLMDIE